MRDFRLCPCIVGHHRQRKIPRDTHAYYVVRQSSYEHAEVRDIFPSRDGRKEEKMLELLHVFV